MNTIKVAATIVISCVLLIGIIVIGAGVALYLQFKPNSRVFILDNIKLMGRLESRQASYGYVEMGNARMPYPDTLGFCFRCGDTEVNVGDTTVEELTGLAASVESANPESISGGRWPDDARRLRLCTSTIQIVVWEGAVLQVIASPRRARRGSSQSQPDLEIRTDRSSAWISVPFTDAEAVTLFGTPDRTTDSFIH